MRLTPAEAARRCAKMAERLSERVDETMAPRSIASRIYPHLRQAKPEEDQPKTRPPIQGWSHLRRK
jgi:hypothetical protein